MTDAEAFTLAQPLYQAKREHAAALNEAKAKRGVIAEIRSLFSRACRPQPDGRPGRRQVFATAADAAAKAAEALLHRRAAMHEFLKMRKADVNGNWATVKWFVPERIEAGSAWVVHISEYADLLVEDGRKGGSADGDEERIRAIILLREVVDSHRAYGAAKAAEGRLRRLERAAAGLDS
jgi:hypothetical protein